MSVHPLALQEQMARACRLREHEVALDYPRGAVLRFYYTLSANLKHASITDAVLIAKDGTEIKWDLAAMSDDELEEVRDSIEADL